MKKLLLFFVFLIFISYMHAQKASDYRKAANRGDAWAQSNLAACYYHGQGVNQDYAQAVNWYRKAAEQGEVIAQYALGVCYYYGQGVTQDIIHAVNWFRKSAEQGDINAQKYLGHCYYFGNGIPEDYSQAVSWYYLAAEQGDAEAQFDLGRCFFSGHGIQQDYAQAIIWYSQAAEQGNGNAQSALAECYYEGRGVAKNYDAVLYWIDKVFQNQDNRLSESDIMRSKEQLIISAVFNEGSKIIEDLGIEINAGVNPPQIEGQYHISPLVLGASINYPVDLFTTNIFESDMLRLTFSEHYKTDPPFMLNCTIDNSGDHIDRITSNAIITGEGNKFSVLTGKIFSEGDYQVKEMEISSGEITSGGIKNYQIAIVRIEEAQTSIKKEYGFLKKDGDGFSERINFNANTPSNNTGSNGVSAHDNIRKTYTASNFFKTGNAVLRNFNGKNYIGDINPENGALLILNSNSSTKVRLSILYRSDTRGGCLIVNGVTQNMDFQSTNWAWGVKTVSGIQLEQGTNTIEFRGGYQTEYAPDIAEITIY